MKELILTLSLVAVCLIALAPFAVTAAKHAGRLVAANALTHPDGKISLKPTAAITERFLIGKRGASASLVAVAAAGDRPLCIIEDTATANDVTIGTPMACALLGATKGTHRAVAAGTVGADVDIYSIGGGKIGTLAQAASGDWRVGRSTTGAGADEPIVFVPELPTFQKPA